jgi:hypothetical protein
MTTVRVVSRLVGQVTFWPSLRTSEKNAVILPIISTSSFYSSVAYHSARRFIFSVSPMGSENRWAAGNGEVFFRPGAQRA